MERRPQNRFLSTITAVGAVGCIGAVGIRYLQSNPITGVWKGNAYYESNGKVVKDETSGDYLIRIHRDGTYDENGNGTSGTWTRNGGTVTLLPTKFLNKTPKEHRQNGIEKKGKVSKTMEMLLDSRMKPVPLVYDAAKDRLTFHEHNLMYVYERME